MDLGKLTGKSGSIKDLISFPRSPLDLPFHVVTARVDDRYERGLSESITRCVASGVSTDPVNAAAAAIGEAWERIAYVHAWDSRRLTPDCRMENELSAEELEALPYLLDRGTGRKAWAERAVGLPWGPVSYLEYLGRDSFSPKKLPAFLDSSAGATSLFETTNGLACAGSFETALDRAACEVVERDALMLVWLTGRGGIRVDPSRFLSPDLCDHISRLSDMGIRVVMRDISTGLGFRVFLTAITASFPERRTAVAFGAGAHVSARRAARHSFLEAGLSWRGVAWRAIAADRPESDVPPRSFSAHSEYYSGWDRMHLLEFLVADERFTESPSEDAEKNGEPGGDCGAIDILRERGFRVFAADITPSEADSLGLKVVQAVIPGLVPLYIGDRCADELAWARLPTTIGGNEVARPEFLNQGYHPWP